jgi:hypothetical protein
MLEKIAAKMYSQVVLGEKDVWSMLKLGNYRLDGGVDVTNFLIVHYAKSWKKVTAFGKFGAKTFERAKPPRVEPDHAPVFFPEAGQPR